MAKILASYKIGATFRWGWVIRCSQILWSRHVGGTYSDTIFYTVRRAIHLKRGRVQGSYQKAVSVHLIGEGGSECKQITYEDTPHPARCCCTSTHHSGRAAKTLRCYELPRGFSTDRSRVHMVHSFNPLGAKIDHRGLIRETTVTSS